MKMQPVQSKAVAAVGYDPTRQVLRVQFPNGKLWEYSGVPIETADALMRAESFGSYFVREIKLKFAGVPVEADAQVSA